MPAWVSLCAEGITRGSVCWLLLPANAEACVGATGGVESVASVEKQK